MDGDGGDRGNQSCNEAEAFTHWGLVVISRLLSTGEISSVKVAGDRQEIPWQDQSQKLG